MEATPRSKHPLSVILESHTRVSMYVHMHVYTHRWSLPHLHRITVIQDEGDLNVQSVKGLRRRCNLGWSFCEFGQYQFATRLQCYVVRFGNVGVTQTCAQQ